MRDEKVKPIELNIDPSKVASIIIKAREFDRNVDRAEPDPGSHEIDSGEREILEDYANDPTLDDLCGAIDVLNDEELIDLVALARLGRGDFTRDEWGQARTFAREAYNWHSRGYLVGMPALGDYLEEGLGQLGCDCSDVNAKHLRDRAMMMCRSLAKISMVAVAVVLACCDSNRGDAGLSPQSNVQEDLMASRAIFSPAPAPQSARPSPMPTSNQAPSPPRLGIAGIAQVADVEGNVRRGRDFAFDNCRPCHVVGPDQRSTMRFSDAPDFQSVANMPSTTSASLIVWLTNPHPTMPSLILSPQEASDVIAYIESLRTAR